jgi:hypothetical protein
MRLRSGAWMRTCQVFSRASTMSSGVFRTRLQGVFARRKPQTFSMALSLGEYPPQAAPGASPAPRSRQRSDGEAAGNGAKPESRDCLLRPRPGRRTEPTRAMHGGFRQSHPGCRSRLALTGTEIGSSQGEISCFGLPVFWSTAFTPTASGQREPAPGCSAACRPRRDAAMIDACHGRRRNHHRHRARYGVGQDGRWRRRDRPWLRPCQAGHAGGAGS